MNRLLSLPLLAVGLLLLGLPSAALAQTAPLKRHVQAYAVDTGLHANARSAAPEVAYTEIIEVPGAPWLRLHFGEVALGKGSYLTVTSLLDGAQQRLDAAALAVWENTSAYFNGDALRIELHVAPGDESVFARVREVVVGEHGAPESQCGPTDDRQPSNDPRAGRLLSIGCTAWLIEDGRFVSAGHCVASGGSANVVEFNVPLSTAGGTLQHPGPEDQYIVNDPSIVFSNGGIGNDWGVFTTAPNTQTGLTALEAQGAAFTLVQDLGPSTIRITGYGVDSGAANQTQQTHTGPNAGSSGTTMRYRTDTEGGNSGSPVIDEATNRAVGVHTHGGCTTSGTGNNSGTSAFNAAFWQEITREFPVAVFTPDLSEGIDVTLASGASGTAQITIRNEGEGDLTFDFTRYSTEGSGGPDTFGYAWIDSNEPGGPAYSWFDVSAIGTPGPSSDDSSVDVTLPWPFEFYGVAKTTAKMSSNGYVTFGSDGTDFSNDPIPDTEEPNDLVAGFWDDLNPSTTGGQTDHYYDAANQRYIFQWTNVARFSDAASRVTFQIILYQNGVIEHMYNTMTGNLTSATVGLEDASGLTGLQVVNDGAYVENNLAVRYDLVPSFVTGVSPATGTVPEGQSATVTVALSADGLDAGTYLNYLAVQTNEPASYSYPVTLEVTGVAAVSLSATNTTPLTVPAGGSISFDYAVTNNTGSALSGDLFFRAIRGGNQVAAGVIRSGALPAGQSVSGSYTQNVPGNTPPGTYGYTLNVGNFPGVTVASQAFSVTVTGTGRASAADDWAVTDAMPWAPVEASVLSASEVVEGVYPNPFTSQARIAFALDADADVRLAVYDVLGREVAVLVDGPQKAGTHQALFDARGLSAGTYLYRLTVGTEVTTRRMTLLD